MRSMLSDMLYSCAYSNQYATIQQDTEPGSVQQLECLGSYEIVFTVDLELNITQTNHPNYGPMTCVLANQTGVTELFLRSGGKAPTAHDIVKRFYQQCQPYV